MKNFKKKGFVVAGVVVDSEGYGIEERAKKEMYPWITLVELDKQNRI